MTIGDADVKVETEDGQTKDGILGFLGFSKKKEGSESEKTNKKSVNVSLNLKEPRFLIGQNGQTLVSLQKILGIFLNKKLKENFYLNLDINDYKKNKINYLKKLAKDSADEAVFTKEKQILSPMPAYERRIIHMELSERKDVVVKSQGEGFERCVVIEPSID